MRRKCESFLEIGTIISTFAEKIEAMSTKDKLRKRFVSLPKDFTFDEIVTLLEGFGYVMENKGMTSGSRVRFRKQAGVYIDIHRPHPGNVMKSWMMREIYDHLKKNNLIQ